MGGGGGGGGGGGTQLNALGQKMCLGARGNKELGGGGGGGGQLLHYVLYSLDWTPSAEVGQTIVNLFPPVLRTP